MTPFKEKPVKWDGDHGEGRFQNSQGYKYDVVNQTVVKQTEEMPEFFLANTAEEAQALYERFSKTLNLLSGNYATATGIPKTDLFGEALIGLARANRDWDPKRSNDFRTYAIYRIKDALREYCASNMNCVSVPVYLRLSHKHYKELCSICNEYKIPVDTLAIEQEIPDCFEPEDAIRSAELVVNLINASNRARTNYRVYLERIKSIPEDECFDQQLPPELEERQSRQLEAALVVDKIKKFISEDELLICDGIMKDKTYEEIAAELDKSKAWVSKKIKEIRTKVLKKMKT